MQENLGKLILRLTVGCLLLFHGVHKVLDGIDDIKQMLSAHNLPDPLAYGVYVGEVAGPVLVIIGLFSRIGGLLIGVNMVVAIALAGLGSIAAINAYGGYALELECFYLFGGLAIACLGAGSIGVGGENGRWN